MYDAIVIDANGRSHEAGPCNSLAVPDHWPRLTRADGGHAALRPEAIFAIVLKPSQAAGPVGIVTNSGERTPVAPA